MSEIVCQTIGLGKQYKNFHALCDINLSVKRGEIYGLVGENGAGKSTLMRLITGLSFPSSGKIRLFGVTKDLQRERSRIGCTVETPALYKDMTAAQNLEIRRIQRGIPDKSCVLRTLELVGLHSAEKKKVVNFSLGMKQRLALAIALLGEPELLILDEPVNGLDPTGIIELREMLKALVKEKQITILISSHILSELNQLATCYGFLHKGRLLQQITASQLGEKCKRHIKMRTDNITATAAVLEEQLKIKKFSVFPDNSVRVYERLGETGAITRALSANGIVIEEIVVQGEDLETYFEKLIGGVINV